MFLIRTVKATTRQLYSQVQKLTSGDFVLIYQMGKVGSTALERTVHNALHFHTLYNNPHCRFRARLKWGWLGTRFFLPVGYFLKRFLIRRSKRIRIVTLVRHPIARARSVFFQELPYWLVLYSSRRGLDERQEGASLLTEAFREVFNIDYYDRWFDEELKRFTGIDVFDHKFDAENGCVLLQDGKYEVLVVQYEKLAVAQPHIEAFIGQELDLTRENVSTNKWYGPIMKNFTEEDIARLPECRQLLESRTSTFFGYSVVTDANTET